VTDFAQLITVLGAGVTTTIGVCVYLLKTQQKEREKEREQERLERQRQDERSDQRIDKLFGMIDNRVHEQTEVIRTLNNTMQELSNDFKEQSRRLEDVEHAVGKIRHSA
jgi:uncharacterized protein HemX